MIVYAQSLVLWCRQRHSVPRRSRIPSRGGIAGYGARVAVPMPQSAAEASGPLDRR